MNAVEEVILKADEERRDIFMHLHHMFTGRLEMKPKLRYRIPFYDHFKWVCYLNPLRKGGVELVFIEGQKLTDHTGILQSRNRQTAAGIIIHSLEELPEKEVVILTEEAMARTPAITFRV